MREVGRSETMMMEGSTLDIFLLRIARSHDIAPPLHGRPEEPTNRGSCSRSWLVYAVNQEAAVDHCCSNVLSVSIEGGERGEGFVSDVRWPSAG